MGTRGINNKSYTLWEELNLRVSNDVDKVSIYKRQHAQKNIPIEDRAYYIHIPVPNTKGGIRKSLRTSDREIAIELANELFIEVKVDLKSGNSIIPVPVEDVVEKFLLYKKSLIRGKWESKKEGGRKSITNERYILIAGKLRNYLTGFLGKKTDARSIPYKKWNGWEMWRNV